MKRLKIGIMGTRGIPNHYGGFEQFAEYLSQGLLDRGHDVWVYNSSLHPYQEKQWNGVSIIHCKDWENKIGTAGQFVYDWNCIQDARDRNFDVLLHLGYTSDSVWHWRWPRRAINIVNMDGLEWKRSKYNRLTQRFLKWAEGLAARHAHSLIADSPAIRDHIMNQYNRLPTYIAYGASLFTNPEPERLDKYRLAPNNYFLVVARMEPENNIETIVRGYLDSGNACPLLVVGNIGNKFGQYLTSRYQSPTLRFSEGIYDKTELDNLRYHCSLYFHGHTVGGTNPSLIEAMACQCTIVAHDNRFNQAVLNGDALYFNQAADICQLLSKDVSAYPAEAWRRANIEKVRNQYNQDAIIDGYENLMLETCGISRPRVTAVVAEAV